MHRGTSSLAVVVALALTACGAQPAEPSADAETVSAGTPSAEPSPSPSASEEPIGPDGAGADRFELMQDGAGGVVLDGGTLTLVFRNGLRYEVETGPSAGGTDPVRALTAGQDALITSAAGLTTISPDGSATHVDTSGAVTTRMPDGSGTVVDSEGTITVDSDGSVVCVGAQGVQVVSATGAAVSTGPSGVLALDGTGRSTAVGADAAAGVQPVGRFSVCGIGGTMTIDLAGDVLFEFDSDRLTPEAEAVVDHAAQMIRSAAKGPVTVTGHTDSMGSDAYNLDLSQRRAAAVVAALGARLGAAVQLTAEGAGESQPVAPNTTPTGDDDPRGRAQNRRVTIEFRR
ncbi:OmpA family protein [Thalassiella azotivora]